MKKTSKDFIWNTLGSGLNSINSLLFMIVVTRINGMVNAGIFALCYSVSCILYIIGIYSGRTYQVSEKETKINDKEYILNRIINSFIMIIIGTIFGIFKGFSSYKMLILILLCIFKASESIADVFYGILQKNGKLSSAGKSIFLKSMLNIIIFAFLEFTTKNLIISCLSMSIINIVIIFLFDNKVTKVYFDKNTKINIKNVINIYNLGFNTFLFTLLSNLLINIPRFSVDKYLIIEYQTIYGILVMPASIVMLLTQFIFQPAILYLKNSTENTKNFIKITVYLIFATILIGTFSVSISYKYGIPLLNKIYSIDLNIYKQELITVIIGATIYTISSVLSNCLIIIRKTKIQVYIYLSSCCISYFISNLLVKNFGIKGSMFSYLISMIVLLSIYIISFYCIMKKRRKNEKNNLF